MPRNFRIIDCDQRSPLWLKARAGLITGTAAADLLAKPLKSGGEPACKRDLRTRLVVERLTGEPAEDNGYVNADMRRGTELEPDAFAAYEAQTGELVQRFGFLQHLTLPIGCSPDGIMGDFEGVLELKVPRSATHLRYWKSGGIPPEHEAQCVHNLLVTGARYLDFVSYDPRFPEPLRLYRARLERDDKVLKSYELAITLFWKEVEKELAETRGLMAAEVA